MYDRLDKIFLASYKKYEYDVKVSRTRTFVRGQRRTKVRPCGRTLTEDIFTILFYLAIMNTHIKVEQKIRHYYHTHY